MPNFSGVWDLKDQVQAIAAGRWPSQYELFSWGDNSSGELGLGDTVNRSSPVQVGALTTWSTVSGGAFCSFAIRNDGTLWSWGQNSNFGNLGDNTIINKSSPVQVGALTDWAKLSVYGSPSGNIAIKIDGTMWAWGSNASGQVGDNTVVLRSSPVQIGALTTWYQVSGGASHSTALKTDGTLWVWGSNTNGRLGDGTAIARSSPVQVGALTDWAQVSGGGAFTAAVKTGGTLWTWGRNADGQLGSGAVLDRSSPVQVGALTNWAQVSGGQTHCEAVKTDGTLWAWGSNGTGRLGDGTVVNRSSPVQIGLLTNWSSVSSGQAFTAARKTDGTAWAWGSNSVLASVGDNTTINRSSPVQIGSLTTWYQLQAGLNQTVAITKYP